MTEKRFNIHEQMSSILGYECVFDNQKEEWLSIRDTILCLIELAEENEQLKQKLKEHKTTLKGQSNRIYQLKKENELLKRRLEEWV